MPDINFTYTCYNCDKHLPQAHTPATSSVTNCDSCFPAGTVLRTCSGCHEARYCGAVCQQEHWKSGHKAGCKAFKDVVELSERHGPLVAAQRKRLLSWVKKNQAITNLAAGFAVGAGTNQDRSQTHCFLIMVKATQKSTEEKPDALSPLSVISADAVADAKIRSMLGGSETLISKLLSKQTNRVKEIFFDPDLPSGLGLIQMQVKTVDMPFIRQDMGDTSFDWQAWLQASFAAMRNVALDNYLIPNDPRQKLRRDTMIVWSSAHGEQFAMAAYSALNLRESTSKLYTHALRVHVDARSSGKQAPFQFKVRSAEVVSFDESGKAPPHSADQGFIHTDIVDDGLPERISSSMIALDTGKSRVQGMYRHRDNWLRHLKKVVDQF